MIHTFVRGALASAVLLLFAAPVGAQQQDSVQTTGSILVDAPPPIPPPALLAGDPRARRAGALLVRVEVFDTSAARLARQLNRLLAAPDAECAAAGAVVRGLELVTRASGEALDTILSGLQQLPQDPLLDGLRDRGSQAVARRTDATEDLQPLRSRVSSSCAALHAAPTPWLPDAELTPVDGRVVLFVRCQPGTVAWVGGHPAGAGDADGWTAVVAPVGDVSLCAAPAGSETCTDPITVTASMVSAFDLSSLRD